MSTFVFFHYKNYWAWAGSRMTKKENAKIVTNILVNIVLFIIYAHYFGQQSVQKHLEKGVTIVRYTEAPSVIPPPGTFK